MKSVVQQAKKTAQQGFSLVELMVVVTIIGILAGIAVPKFQTFKARANQTEAKSGLQGLYLAVQAFEANYNELPSYAASSDPATTNTGQGAPLGFILTGAKQKYIYRVISSAVTSVGSTGWAATATSTQTMRAGTVNSLDEMRINTNKWLCSPWDAVTGTAAVAATAATASAGASAARECPQVGSAITTGVLDPVLSPFDAP